METIHSTDIPTLAAERLTHHGIDTHEQPAENILAAYTLGLLDLTTEEVRINLASAIRSADELETQSESDVA